MKSLLELNDAVKKVIEVANTINDDCNAEIWDKAPLIIHQRFCAKLVEVMKEHPNKIASEVPKVMEVMTAINILEELYPQLVKN